MLLFIVRVLEIGSGVNIIRLLVLTNHPSSSFIISQATLLGSCSFVPRPVVYVLHIQNKLIAESVKHYGEQLTNQSTNQISNKLTSWDRVLLKKLAVKKFTAFHGTRRYSISSVSICISSWALREVFPLVFPNICVLHAHSSSLIRLSFRHPFIIVHMPSAC
jgi:hypothetical protein